MSRQPGAGEFGNRAYRAGFSPSQYGTVNGLLAFISWAMPYGDPGSLTASQYNQITAFLVVEDGLVDGATLWKDLVDIGLSKSGG